MMQRIAKAWDQIPVKGLMATVVAVVGAVLVLVGSPSGSGCKDAGGLRHVYRPARLHVVSTCQQVTFRVVSWAHEHDGDYHVDGVVDGGGWTNPSNVRSQHGYTVFEFVPGDPRPAHFYAGQRLRVLTTRVTDTVHGGWIEGHPIFSETELGGTPTTAGAAPVDDQQ